MSGSAYATAGRPSRCEWLSVRNELIMLLELRADISVGSNFLGIDYYNRVDFVCFHAIVGSSRETEISGERHVEYQVL